MVRDLDDKGLGQNRVLCSFSGVELPMVKLPLQATRCFLRQEDRSPASRRLLAFKTTLTRIPLCRLFLVASSLQHYLARFLARLDGCPCFCFVESWVVGLAMDEAESNGADVAIGFFGWSL